MNSPTVPTHSTADSTAIALKIRRFTMGDHTALARRLDLRLD